MNRFALLILMSLPFAANAAAADLSAEASAKAEWNIDPTRSSISFDDTQSGQPFTGGFKKFDGEIAFNPQHLDQSHANITIDIQSIHVGGDGDTYAQAAEWFDTDKFPTATFETISFTKTGAGQFMAHGKLTIRDVTLPLDLPFSLTFSPDGKTATMQGTVTLNRLDYHLGTGSWADDKTAGIKVPVRVNITATMMEKFGAPGR